MVKKMKWFSRKKKLSAEEWEAQYQHYQDTTNHWFVMSNKRKQEKISELKCDLHPEAIFEQSKFILSWNMGDPIIYACSECDTKANNRTIFVYCNNCGWVKGYPRSEPYKSPDWTWRSLCGRQGYHYFCRKCNKQVGSIYTIIS